MIRVKVLLWLGKGKASSLGTNRGGGGRVLLLAGQGRASILWMPGFLRIEHLYVHVHV